MEDIYQKKNNGEELNTYEKETMDDIESENDRIFNRTKTSNLYDGLEDKQTDNKKGRHF